jgi:hypothetical protein
VERDDGYALILPTFDHTAEQDGTPSPTTKGKFTVFNSTVSSGQC